LKAPSRNGYKGIRQPARQVGKSVPPLQEKNGFNHESQQRFPPYSLLTSSVRALACASAAWRKDPPLSIGLELWITKCSSPSVSNKNCGAYRCNSYVVVVAKSSRLLLFFCCQLGWNSLSLSLSLSLSRSKWEVFLCGQFCCSHCSCKDDHKVLFSICHRPRRCVHDK
jgi:hypothetical protein